MPDQDPILRVLEKARISVTCEFSAIDEATFLEGGLCCHHASHDDDWHNYEWIAAPVPQVEVTEYGDYAPDDHLNQNHRDCSISPDRIRILGAKVVIQRRWVKTQNGSEVPLVERIVIDPAADREEAAQLLRAALQNH